MSSGPLHDVRVVELSGLGPAPFAAMVLAGLGATVVRVDRITAVADEPIPGNELLNRGRPCVAVDLKHPDGVRTVRQLTESADIFIEGFRPGVTERLGLGPDDLFATNPKLIYARMTGWGQDGPLCHTVGHDINYIARTGALHAIGTAERPVPPLNLIGDFGGGAMVLLTGVLAALHERTTSGRGQVIDAAMIDGTAMLMSMAYDFHNAGEQIDYREANLLDGGAPFYGTYQCADGGWIAVGAIEAPFFAEFERRLGLGPLGPQWDRPSWPDVRKRIAEQVRTRTRTQWCEVFVDSDACVSPVLSIAEVADDPQIIARNAVARGSDESMQTTVAPQFSRTPSPALAPPARSGEHTRQSLLEWGFNSGEIDALLAAGAVAQRPT